MGARLAVHVACRRRGFCVVCCVLVFSDKDFCWLLVVFGFGDYEVFLDFGAPTFRKEVLHRAASALLNMLLNPRPAF